MKTKTMPQEEQEADLNKMLDVLEDAGMRIRISTTSSRQLLARYGDRDPRRLRYHLEIASGPADEAASTEMAWHIKGNLQKVYDAVVAMHMVITYQAAVKNTAKAA